MNAKKIKRLKGVAISQEHYNQLCNLGKLNDTFDDVIGRLLEERGGEA